MLVIDNIPYDVDYTQFKSTSKTERKYSLTTADGRVHGEKQGSYRTYSLSIGKAPASTIMALADHLDDGNSYHNIMLYDGTNANTLLSINAMVDSVERDIQTVDDRTGDIRYNPLVVSFSSRDPEVR